MLNMCGVENAKDIMQTMRAAEGAEFDRAEAKLKEKGYPLPQWRGTSPEPLSLILASQFMRQLLTKEPISGGQGYVIEGYDIAPDDILIDLHALQQYLAFIAINIAG